MKTDDLWRAVGVFMLAVFLIAAPTLVGGLGPVEPRWLIVRGVYWCALYLVLLAFWVRTPASMTKLLLLVLLVFAPYYVLVFSEATQTPNLLLTHPRVGGVIGLAYFLLGCVVIESLRRRYHLTKTDADTTAPTPKSYAPAVLFFLALLCYAAARLFTK